MMYEDALTILSDLCEPLEDCPADYLRGGVNLLADLFPVEGLDTGERIEQIERDLRNRSRRSQPTTFDTQLLIDADHGADGWEIVLRFGPDDMEASWSGLTDQELMRTDTAIEVGRAVLDAVLNARPNEAEGQ